MTGEIYEPLRMARVRGDSHRPNASRSKQTKGGDLPNIPGTASPSAFDRPSRPEMTAHYDKAARGRDLDCSISEGRIPTCTGLKYGVHRRVTLL